MTWGSGPVEASLVLAASLGAPSGPSGRAQGGASPSSHDPSPFPLPFPQTQNTTSPLQTTLPRLGGLDQPSCSAFLTCPCLGPHPCLFLQIILLPVPARPVDKHSLNHPSCRLSCHEGRVTPFLRPTQSFAISSGSHQLPVLWLQPLPWAVSHQHSIAWYSLF